MSKRPVEPNDLDQLALEYVARESVRRYGPPSDDLPAKLRRNVRRNFTVSVPLDQLTSLIHHYKAMYAYAASVLNQHMKPSLPGKFADWSHIDIPTYNATVQRAYKNEPASIVQTIVNYAIYYEYLR